jgi:hypothetical protein
MTLATLARFRINSILEPKHPLRPLKTVTPNTKTYLCVYILVYSLFPSQLMALLTSSYSQSSPASACQHALVLVNRILALCRRTGPSSAVLHPRSISSRPLSMETKGRYLNPPSGRRLMYVEPHERVGWNNKLSRRVQAAYAWQNNSDNLYIRDPTVTRLNPYIGGTRSLP